MRQGVCERHLMRSDDNLRERDSSFLLVQLNSAEANIVIHILPEAQFTDGRESEIFWASNVDRASEGSGCLVYCHGQSIKREHLTAQSAMDGKFLCRGLS